MSSTQCPLDGAILFFIFFNEDPSIEQRNIFHNNVILKVKTLRLDLELDFIEENIFVLNL